MISTSSNQTIQIPEPSRPKVDNLHDAIMAMEQVTIRLEGMLAEIRGEPCNAPTPKDTIPSVSLATMLNSGSHAINDNTKHHLQLIDQIKEELF